MTPLDPNGINAPGANMGGVGEMVDAGDLGRPAHETDEDRHGEWNKAEQRYEDGCTEDRPHPEGPRTPYRYLISYTGTQGGQLKQGHFPLDRSKPFTNAALMPVLNFIAERVGLDGPPVILGIFTFADSADAAVRAR